MIMRGHFLRQNLMTGDFDEKHSKAELQSKSSAIRMDEGTDRRQGNEEMNRVWLAEKKNSARKERFQNCKMNHMRSMVRPEGMDSPIPSDGLAKSKRKNNFLKFRKRWLWFIWSAWMRKLWKDGRVGMPHVIYCQKRDHYQARTKQLWTWQVMMRWRIYELQRKSGKFPQRGNHLPTIVNCLLGVCVFLCLHLHLDISLATLILFCSDRGLSPRCADEI